MSSTVRIKDLTPVTSPQKNESLVLDGDSGARRIIYGDLKDNILADNIIKEIGGRNFLLNSDDPAITAVDDASLSITKDIVVEDWNAVDAIHITSTGGNSSVKAYISARRPQDYGYDETTCFTESIFIKNNSTSSVIVDGTNGVSPQTVNGGEAVHVILNCSYDISTYMQIRFSTAASSTDLDVTFWHPKIEIGNTATRWTLAPEDIMRITNDEIDALETDEES